MKISKKDALMWFDFFAQLPEDEPLQIKQQEIMYATLTQIERRVQHTIKEKQSAIKNLKNFHNRTFYVGNDDKFPKGCQSCLTGSGLGAIRKTHTCNLNCPFCYHHGQTDCQEPIGEGLFEIGGTRYYEEDVRDLLSIQGKPSGVSYVYLEPFMDIHKYYNIIKIFKENNVHQHMYTNGTLVTEDSLKKLKDSGLDELRFNLGASNCADKVIDNMRLAKQYIPYVGIETPMTRDFEEQFKQKKNAILQTGIDFINCAELHLNENNLQNYDTENLYMSRMGYVSPIYSRLITLDIMKQADDEKWDMVVHDCSNHTKFKRGMHLRKVEGGWFGANNYNSEFPIPPFYAFLPTLNDPEFTFLEEEEMPKGYVGADILL